MPGSRALDWLDRFRTHSAKINYGDRRYVEGAGLALAAMTRHRLGQPEQARQCLDESERLAGEAPQPGRADMGYGPENWMVWQVLHREAKGLIGGAAAPGGAG